RASACQAGNSSGTSTTPSALGNEALALPSAVRNTLRKLIALPPCRKLTQRKVPHPCPDDARAVGSGRLAPAPGKSWQGEGRAERSKGFADRIGRGFADVQQILVGRGNPEGTWHTAGDPVVRGGGSGPVGATAGGEEAQEGRGREKGRR